MTTGEFYERASGLVVPAGSVPPPEFEPESFSACEELLEIQQGLQDVVGYGEETSANQIVMIECHNSLGRGCDNLCGSTNMGCAVNEVINDLNRPIDDNLEVIEEGPEANFKAEIINTLVYLENRNDGIIRLSPIGRTMQGIYRVHLDGFLRDNPQLQDVVPTVTPGAYEVLAKLSGAGVSPGPNFTVALRVIGSLIEASIDQHQNPDDNELEQRHKVIPTRPGVITQADVKALYAYPDDNWQYWLRIANQPKAHLSS